MIRREVRVAAEVPAPQDAVWERVSEHERTPTWVNAVRSVRLAREGSPRNGAGAIRIVEFKPRLWSTIHEEITRFEPPHVFEYVLFKGMPGLAEHLGRVAVDDLGAGRSRLRWEVDFGFRDLHPFRLFLPQFIRDFDAVLADGVHTLSEQFAAPARSRP